MSALPFFSILLPTKNRSHLVDYSIKSVLNQDFENFELIVCDNDDDSKKTRLIVEKYSDARIKYIRTGGYTMVDNWNLALDKSIGQHVIVLEDKMIFYPNALFEIKSLIVKSKNSVIVWKTNSINDESEESSLTEQLHSENVVIKSSDSLKKVTTNVMAHWGLLPRGLCSSIPKRLIEEIVKDSKGKFYNEINPDFISSIKVLMYIEEYIFSGTAYNLITSSKVSNGKNIKLRKFKDQSYYMGNTKLMPFLRNVPVKSEWIIANIVISDYLRLRENYHEKLKQYEIKNKQYFEMLFRELISTTISEKRIIWSKSEIWTLFKTGDGFLINVFFAFNLMLKKIFKDHFTNQIKKHKQSQKTTHVNASQYIESCINSVKYKR
jgi:glycosyltransferase involved in cell wall biosynthesis